MAPAAAFDKLRLLRQEAAQQLSVPLGGQPAAQPAQVATQDGVMREMADAEVASPALPSSGQGACGQQGAQQGGTAGCAFGARAGLQRLGGQQDGVAGRLEALRRLREGGAALLAAGGSM